MKVGFLITARMKSKRLPLKLTRKLGDREIIRYMLDRLKLSKELKNIVICTSANPQDEILTSIAREEGVDFFLGSEEDVILRLYEAAKAFSLDYVLNITADCPLVAHEYFSMIIEEYRASKSDFIRTSGLPHGLYCYGIDVGALKRVCEVKESSSTEVWGRYFTDTNLFKVLDIQIPEHHRRNYRLTLDYPEDLEVLEKFYGHFGKDIYKKRVDEIIDYLDTHPEVVRINEHCKNGYKKRFNEQDKIKLKKDHLGVS